MPNKMLIDTTHREETRVVVLRGNRVEEFDFESASRKPLRGNIYLAKVTRVEPSLQAAFVDYGGNRHGFLAFSEIHPDYYQIPVADRQALIEEDARFEREAAKKADEGGRRRSRSKKDDEADAESSHEHEGDDGDHEGGEDSIEHLGGGDALEELPERPRGGRRQYKIQEVIKRRQILLVQVVKEERGTKGAALTTYLSLAGRYSVLMPNTARGGGISRKITNTVDRKRLKATMQDIEVPEGMGVILRTAGASRTKTEIKRDFEYLLRMWENVRELTLKSTAPSLTYEEGSLLKRAIRDLYSKDIEEILVAGDDGYREAKDFMRMLMPSHAKQVKAFKEEQPLFTRFGVESQLDAMFSNHVTLKSGGYLVINQTEALVAIDVNSGRSTREHNIEDTALRTNMEAAEEVARQLRLRDLAGLIVIDFIDMEENRNNRAVERRVKECLKNDRARIQVGRISPFGLMEMSRQRIRTGVVEGSSIVCPHCGGSGHVRATPSVALHILRMLEEQLVRSSTHDVIVRARMEVAFYILNQKRMHLRELERRFGVAITFVADEELGAGRTFQIDRGELANPAEVRGPVTGIMADEPEADLDESEDDEAEIDETEDEDEEEAETEAGTRTEAARSSDGREARGEEEGGRRRRRRRRRRGRGERGEQAPGAERTDEAHAAREDNSEREDEATGDDDESTGTPSPVATSAEGEERARRRRRGRRGGRRGGRHEHELGHENEHGGDETTASDLPIVDAIAGPLEETGIAAAALPEPESAPAPVVAEEALAKPKRSRARAKAKSEDVTVAAPQPSEELAAEPVKKPARRSRAKARPEEAPVVALAAQAKEEPTVVVSVTPPSKQEPAKPVVAPVEPEPAMAEAAAEHHAPARAPTTSNPDAYKVNETASTGPKKAGWWSRAKQVLSSN